MGRARLARSFCAFGRNEAKKLAAEIKAAAKKEAEEKRASKKFEATFARLLRANPELEPYVAYVDGEPWVAPEGVALFLSKMRLDSGQRKAANAICELASAVKRGDADLGF
eukprot:jgi/Mesvir1/26732/Mv20508-RA.1